MKSRFYTAQEVAEMLGVHQSTAYKIIKESFVVFILMGDEYREKSGAATLQESGR